MDKAELARKLASIAQVEYDAARAYEEAIENTGKNDTRDHLVRFRDEHLRHIDGINEAIRDLGEEPSVYYQNPQGYATAVMSSPSGAEDIRAMLQIMQRNEYFSNAKYDDAVADDEYTTYPLTVQSLLQRNYLEEKRHQSYIDSALKQPVEVE